MTSNCVSMDAAAPLVILDNVEVVLRVQSSIHASPEGMMETSARSFQPPLTEEKSTGPQN